MFNMPLIHLSEMTPAKRVRDDRQDAILQAAHTLIIEGSLESLSMANLARATKLSRPSIYQYFSSREDILAELLINEMADLSNAIDREIARSDDPTEHIKIWIELSLRYLSSDEHRFISQISMASVPEQKRGMLHAMHGHFLTSLISPLVKLGVADSTATCQFVYGSVAASADRINQGAEFQKELRALERFVMADIKGALN
jgi:AcrR family transcriptional regulator